MTDSILERMAPGVREIRPYEPGKPIAELAREHGLSDIIKLASNENPLGPSAAAVQAYAQCAAELARYPDGGGFDLKQALARRHGVAPACITLGNGSNDILVMLAEAFLTPGRESVCSQYAFAAYPIAVQCTGAKGRVAPAHPAGGPMAMGHDLRAMTEQVNEQTALVYIANPNNPTGTLVNGDELRTFIAALPEQVTVVVDEAYWDYVKAGDYPDTTQWLDEYPNLVVTRTFSKAFGLAGLRVGYSVSSPAIADAMNRVRQPFNTSIPAQVAALAALGDSAHMQRSIAVNDDGLRTLSAALEDMDIGYVPSVCNFILADMGRPAAPVFEALLKAGVIVRPVANYGLPDHLRISIGLPEENARLIRALREILNRDPVAEPRSR